MKKLLALTLGAGLATAGAQTTTATISATPVFGSPTGIELGLTGGYAGGLSGGVFVHAPNLAGPFGVKASASYTRASNAINTSQDLIVLDAQRSGQYVSVGLDGTYTLGELTPGVGATLYAGGRYGVFSATEDYGTSGSLNYRTTPFGVGGGLMLSYALAGNLSLVGDLGVDQFFRSAITTTTVSPDGTFRTETIPTNDGSYNAVSNRFVRPGTVFKARVGIKVTF